MQSTRHSGSELKLRGTRGIAKVKGKYKSFKDDRGATTDAALAKFNEFYKNPGTAGAPAK